MTQPPVATQPGSAVARLLRAGVRDATSRLTQWINRPRPDESIVERAIVSSLPVRAVADVLGHLRAAAGTSIAFGAVRRALGAWMALGTRLQRRLVGVVLVTASVTHIALAATHRTPPGSFWLVLPALAAAVGLLCLLMSTEPEPGAPS